MPGVQFLNSQKTPHSLPSQANYGVTVVRILEKIDHVITALHCTLKSCVTGWLKFRP